MIIGPALAVLSTAVGAVMDEGASRLACSGRFPRLLIAADYASALEPLLGTFRDGRLDVDFDLCTSQMSAVRKLSARPYQLIIAGAHFAETDDFFLLKRSQALQGFVPVVVTASTFERQSAARVLACGAFDVIPCPPDHEQTVGTILLALWQSKLRSLVACKERAAERCRQHLADYPGDRFHVEASFQGVLSAFEKTILAVEQSLLRIEQCDVSLCDWVIKVENEARKRAFERLNGLNREG
jgi:hypothetical protein